MVFVATKIFHKAGEGTGGSDPHNLGWYATESALNAAHAEASDGDWAIVGATDTVWVWDGDTNAWVDTGAAGIELPDQTGNSGKFLTTDGTSASWGDALKNTATGTDSLSILGTATNKAFATAVGSGAAAGASSVSIGCASSAGVSGGNNSSAIAIGAGAKVTSTGGAGGLAIGRDVVVSGAYSLGIYRSVSGNNSISIPGGSVSGVAPLSGNSVVQIGAYNQPGNNSIQIGINPTDIPANKFYVWQHELLDKTDGTIPEARLADTTSAAQGDVLTLDSNGDAQWAAGTSITFRTWGANE